MCKCWGKTRELYRPPTRPATAIRWRGRRGDGAGKNSDEETYYLQEVMNPFHVENDSLILSTDVNLSPGFSQVAPTRHT